MEPPIQAILFLGIIPALILLFFGLKNYDDYYKDKTVFLTFIVGIIFGVVAVVFRLFSGILPFMIIYVFLFAVFEQLFKTIVLNIGSFQGKKETVIYGLSLGLGFGSSFTPFLILTGSSITSDIFLLSWFGFGSLGFILFHAATGILIGYGVYIKKTMKYVLYAILLQIPFNLLFDGTRQYTNVYFTYFQLGLILYGGFLFWYSITKIMPLILEDKKEKNREVKNG